MAHSTGPLLALVLTFAVFAGCTSPEPGPLNGLEETGAADESGDATSVAPGGGTATTGQVDNATPEGKTETTVERRSVRVYASRGWFVGMDPAHPVEDGPLVENPYMFMGREDMFLVPPGTVGLNVSFNFQDGAGSGGIEIVHESGLVVYRQEYLLAAEGRRWGGCVGFQCTNAYVGEELWAADSSPPGNYRLLYHFGGAVYVNITVYAIVEG